MKASLKSLPSKHLERKKFTEQIVSLMIQGKHLIFADETSINLWDRKRINKTWQKEDEPIHHVVNTKRLDNMTVYGAVSNKLPRLIFMTGTKTDAEQFKEFLKLITREVQQR